MIYTLPIKTCDCPVRYVNWPEGKVNIIITSPLFLAPWSQKEKTYLGFEQNQGGQKRQGLNRTEVTGYARMPARTGERKR